MRRAILIPFLVVTALPGFAAEDSEIQQLKRDLYRLVSRVEALERENQELRDATRDVAVSLKKSGAAKPAGPKIKGDLRIRYENIQVQGGSDRERSRVRARVAVVANPLDNLEVGVGLASGNDDPVSTNQSLGNGASTKELGLDLAYVNWNVRPGLTLSAGKMKDHFAGPGVFRDGDYRPEGVSFSFADGNAFLTGGAHFLESDTRRLNEQVAFGIQGGYRFALGDASVTAGLGYFHAGTEGHQVFYGDSDEFFGNTHSCSASDPDDCRYLNNYSDIEIFLQLSGELAGRPVTAFFDGMQNADASTLDTAWAVGARFGKASAPGTWELGYTYQSLEADSVLGLWADSDFAGGGTDGRGHIFSGTVAVDKNWSVKLTFFDNVRGMDLGTGQDYRRLQLDTAFKF